MGLALLRSCVRIMKGIMTIRPAPPPQIFSDARRKAVFSRAVTRQGDRNSSRFLWETMTQEIAERLDFMRFEGRNALVIGDASRLLEKELTRRAMTVTHENPVSWMEASRLPGTFDLIVDCGTLASVNDVPGALIQLRAMLNPTGLLLGALIGAGSLPVLRRTMLNAEPTRASPRMHPMIDNRSASALLQRAGFARQVVDGARLTVRYGSLVTLIHDLRDHGMTNVLQKPGPPLNRMQLLRAAKAFDDQKDSQGKVSEMFELLFLTAWNN